MVTWLAMAAPSARPASARSVNRSVSVGQPVARRRPVIGSVSERDPSLDPPLGSDRDPDFDPDRPVTALVDGPPVPGPWPGFVAIRSWSPAPGNTVCDMISTSSCVVEATSGSRGRR